ncbi:MAG: pyruvate carboxylase [Chitinophagaceae bacterium]|nr:MAG: pyruvate carboxylase [Chitinophagaceae bacterium]
MSVLKKINKLLVANRGEIAIRIFRAASELNITTVAVYTFEDRYSLHRYKADEAYQIGEDSEPLKPYLDIEEIIQLAKRQYVDAIHPGYGFLSENVNFARRCKEEGIIFIGPEPEVMEALGDKVTAKTIARKVEVPVIEDSKVPLSDIKVAQKEAEKIGYPIIIKAAAGGGGRGMRVVKNKKELLQLFDSAKSEAKKSFGDDKVFIEKFIDNPKHIEVQILGDNHGNLVHLLERDCSVQRRFQKVVEIAPCPTLKKETKQVLYNYALKIARHVNYNNAGTVEFLVDPDENIYFIEVNPRIQVEHTITEEITGIDIVRSQILIAMGYKLDDPPIFIKDQLEIKANGFAIQCRVTTEDPSSNFQPDYGTIIAYRNAGGFGIRLDEGSSYPGVTISPFFDSMLVKVSSWGRTLWGAAERLDRTLREFRIRGVKNNISFLLNVIRHPVFVKGDATVKFIENHPELFNFERRLDRGTKTLKYLAEVTVNGNPDVKFTDPNKKFRLATIPAYDKYAEFPKGTKNRLQDLGRNGFIDWLSKNKEIQFTDTTFRDAHQSLMATRVRTIDMLAVAESFVKNHPQTFSMEVWGGATFDVALRFLHECPWKRLQSFREAMPNLLLQMLIRSSNAVGYTAYPDNLVEKFIEKSWENGIDIFRIFDSLNWIEPLKKSIKAVNERTEGLAEACICYTGDISNPELKKYTLQYYVDLAKQLEDSGAHILGIKDMAGLLKPYAAEILIDALKKEISIPIHLHTHDTSSIQSATYLKAIEKGVDVVDVAIGSMSGLTSQPNFNSLVSMLETSKRYQKFDMASLNEFSAYWEDVREYYYPFETELKAGTADVFHHEIPGGQYSNLRPQARSLGLEDQFETIKKNYALVNELFGDIVKVTPSSKVVGDLALFMTANNYTVDDLLENGANISFPDSVKSFFRGDLGQPYQGFPKKIQRLILKDEKPYTDHPNAHLKPVDFEAEFAAFQEKFDKHCNFLDFLSYKMYPKVFEDFHKYSNTYGDVSCIPSTAFFYGLKANEEIMVNIGEGKNIIVKLLNVSKPTEDGFRTVFFELNGQTRNISVHDSKLFVPKKSNRKVENAGDIGAPLQGRIEKILVNEGDKVKKNQSLFVIEAMKMENTVVANQSGKVAKILLNAGDMVQQDDVVIEIK